MFAPRLGSYPAPQKNRHFRLTAFKAQRRQGPWTHFVALGQGALAVPFLEKLYLWGKKVCRFPNKTMRFWVNVQAASVVTKKPANLRMGKGKGGRVGSLAKLSAGTTLLAISFLRPGLLQKFKRQISVRASFRVGVAAPSDFLRHKQQSTNRTQRRYTAYMMYDFRYLFRRANQAHSFAFIKNLLRWSRKVPQLGPIAALKHFYTPEEYDDYYALSSVSAFSVEKVVWSAALDWPGVRKRYYLEQEHAPMSRYSEPVLLDVFSSNATLVTLALRSESPRQFLPIFFASFASLAKAATGATVQLWWASNAAFLLRFFWFMGLVETTLDYK